MTPSIAAFISLLILNLWTTFTSDAHCKILEEKIEDLEAEVKALKHTEEQENTQGGK